MCACMRDLYMHVCVLMGDMCVHVHLCVCVLMCVH